jgi:hypothetical protein
MKTALKDKEVLEDLPAVGFMEPFNEIYEA